MEQSKQQLMLCAPPLKAVPAVIANVQKKEVSIYKAKLFDKRLGEFDCLEDDLKLLKLLAEWYLFSGIINTPISEEYNMLADWLISDYPDLNLLDIKTAYTMAASGKLEYKKLESDESFGRFSPTYIGRILTPYRKWKSETCHKVRKEIEKQEETEKSKLPLASATRLEIHKQTLIIAKEKRTAGEMFHDLGHVVYWFIVNNELIDITPELWKEASAHGKRIYVADKSGKTIKSLISKVGAEKMNQETTVRTNAGHYIVNKWLDTINDMPKFCKKITIEMLDKTKP